MACGICEGSEDYTWQEDSPELCSCIREEDPRGRTRITAQFMKISRKLQWEQDQDWEEEDQDRIIDSKEANREDVQDYTVPMVCIGSDVINLYPSLEIEEVVGTIMEEMRTTEVRWEGIDYLEAGPKSSVGPV